MDLRGVLQAQGTGHLALEGGVQDEPDGEDGEQLGAGVALLAPLDVRQLFLGHRRLRGRCTARVGGGHACSSATTTRRMSSSWTTPTTRSPSTTRHGPLLSRTTRAA